MRLVRRELLIDRGEFSLSEEWAVIDEEIRDAIHRVVWPPGNDQFVIYPEPGKGRGMGNGVVPIKLAFFEALADYGWELEQRLWIGNRARPGKIDAIKHLPNGGVFAVEWETGNISSSHRSINKIALGIIQKILVGGAVILPTRRMYQYLTDRIGNYEELEPYFPFWRHVVVEDGALALYAVEHDGESLEVPRIEKGTDGRALL